MPESSSILELLLANGADVTGLLRLRYNESDYQRLVGDATATKIIEALGKAQRRGSQSSRTTQDPRGTRRIIRNWTRCILLYFSANNRILSCPRNSYIMSKAVHPRMLWQVIRDESKLQFTDKIHATLFNLSD